MRSFRLTPRGAQYDVVSRLTGAGGSTAGQVGLVCQFVVICRQAGRQLSAARQLCTIFFLRRYPFFLFLSCFQGGIPCGMGMHLVGHAAAALYLCHHTHTEYIHTPRTRVNVLLSVAQTRDWLGNHQMGFVDGGESSCHFPNLKYRESILIRGLLSTPRAELRLPLRAAYRPQWGSTYSLLLLPLRPGKDACRRRRVRMHLATFLGLRPLPRGVGGTNTHTHPWGRISSVSVGFRGEFWGRAGREGILSGLACTRAL